ncbi:MAG: DUF5615 family PIN-like protein [Candidatus Omnitrophica bacterium]|nr:DUF5615 family PIN-like protein [Candidatus Omnitrophota bacterium]
MKFLLDENVSPLVDDALRSLGHTIVRLPQGTKDMALIQAAKKENAVIISHDKDFITLPFSETNGIILLRIHPPWSKNIIVALKNFLMENRPSDWENKLVLLGKEGFHIRF